MDSPAVHARTVDVCLGACAAGDSVAWWTTKRMQVASELLFEDVEEAPIVSLELKVDSLVQGELSGNVLS